MPQTDAAATTSDAERGQRPRVVKVVERQDRIFFFKYITAFSRTWGLLTATALWGITIPLLKDYQQYNYAPWYLLILCVLFTFFEFVWLINKSTCCRDDGQCCCLIWRALLWIDDWKKTILYFLLSIPCFLQGIRIVLAVVGGILVIVAGVFYFLKSFRYSSCVEKKVREEEEVVEPPTSPTAKLVSYEVQMPATTYGSADIDGESSSVQPAPVKEPSKPPPAPAPTPSTPPPIPPPSAPAKPVQPPVEKDSTAALEVPAASEPQPATVTTVTAPATAGEDQRASVDSS